MDGGLRVVGRRQDLDVVSGPDLALDEHPRVHAASRMDGVLMEMR